MILKNSYSVPVSLTGCVYWTSRYIPEETVFFGNFCIYVSKKLLYFIQKEAKRQFKAKYIYFYICFLLRNSLQAYNLHMYMFQLIFNYFIYINIKVKRVIVKSNQYNFNAAILLYLNTFKFLYIFTIALMKTNIISQNWR